MINQSTNQSISQFKRKKCRGGWKELLCTPLSNINLHVIILLVTLNISSEKQSINHTLDHRQRNFTRHMPINIYNVLHEILQTNHCKKLNKAQKRTRKVDN